MVTIETADPEIMVKNIQNKLGLQAVTTGGEVRVETHEGLNVIKTLLQNFPDDIQAVKLGKPTLEDVFLTKTGHTLKGKEEWN